MRLLLRAQGLVAKQVGIGVPMTKIKELTFHFCGIQWVVGSRATVILIGPLKSKCAT